MSEYVGFVFDIDKTAVPNGAQTVESLALREAFAQLPDNVFAIAATGRSPEFALPITQALNLRHESVVANGALIIDSQSGQPWWQRLLSADQVASIIAVGRPHDYRLWLTGDPEDELLTAAQQHAREVAGAFITDVPAEIAHDIHAELIEIPDVNAYLSQAWGGNKNHLDINIGHTEARKHNALEALFGKYAIDGARMIGVGDGVNDVELFSIVGHKIAVANAHPQLVELADEVVASQEDDGLAEVVRRFHSTV